MTDHLTYANLPQEDKILIDELFQHKEQKIEERKILRNTISELRKREMDCTREIMNLSQRKIGEKFEISYCAAKPFSKNQRKKIIERQNEKESLFYCDCDRAVLHHMVKTA